MLTVPTPKQLGDAIALMGKDGATQNDIHEGLLKFCQDEIIASRLMVWLPEVFGMTYIRNHEFLHMVNINYVFSAQNKNNEWVEINFEAEPIYAIGTQIAESFEKCQAFENICLMSSMLNAVKNAIAEGSQPQDLDISGPVVVGVPAEIYLSVKKSLWQSLFKKF